MKNLLELNKVKSLEKQIQAGTVFIKEGEESSSLYILVRGKIQVIQNGQVLHEISEPGEYFGEISVLLNVPHVASCRAMVPSSLIEIPKDKVESFIKSTPEIGLILARKLAKRLILSDERYIKLRSLVKDIKK